MNDNKEYILGFWSRYREEDDEPLYTVECFEICNEFKSINNVSDWWYDWLEEDEYARDWDMLDLEFCKKVTESEKKQYEKDKQYDCRWIRNWSL